MASLYLETSVVGYLASKPSRDLVAAAHQQITTEWWTLRRQAFEIYISELVLQEIRDGDPEAVARRLAIVAGLRSVSIKPAAVELARALMAHAGIPRSAAADALHIALAAAHGLHFLLTWNCRHIANAETRQRVERTCRGAGFAPPVLCTPEELLGGDDHGP